MSLKTEYIPLYPATNFPLIKKKKKQKKVVPMGSGDYPIYFFSTNETECFYCGCPLTPTTRTKDHIYPKNLGGKLKGNHVFSCQPCNIMKGKWTVIEFRTFLKQKIEKFDNYNKILSKVEFMISKLYPSMHERANINEVDIAAYKLIEAQNKISELSENLIKLGKINKGLEFDKSRLETKVNELQAKALQTRVEIFTAVQKEIKDTLKNKDRIAVKKDERVQLLQKQIAKNNETITRVRKDNQELICQIVQLTNKIEELEKNGKDKNSLC